MHAYSHTQANTRTKVTQSVEPGVNDEFFCPIPSWFRQPSGHAELTQHVPWQLGVAPVVQATTACRIAGSLSFTASYWDTCSPSQVQHCPSLFPLPPPTHTENVSGSPHSALYLVRYLFSRSIVVSPIRSSAEVRS